MMFDRGCFARTCHAVASAKPDPYEFAIYYGATLQADRQYEIATVNPRVAGSTIICFGFIAALLITEPLEGQSGSHSSNEPECSAVDINGVRHRKSDYGDRTPWDSDVTKFVRPDYPSNARASRIEGNGLFRVTLDITTGAVTNVAVLKSTGSSGLDHATIKAMQLWQWKPHRWKEVDVPVTFTMRSGWRHSGSAREVEAHATSRYLKGTTPARSKALMKQSASIRDWWKRTLCAVPLITRKDTSAKR
jgi:TonB family protein